MGKAGTPRPRSPGQILLKKMQKDNPAYEMYHNITREQWKRKQMAAGTVDSMQKAEQLALKEDQVLSDRFSSERNQT